MKAKFINLILILFAKLPLPVARALGNTVGSLCCRLGTREAKVTSVNLSRAFPDEPDGQRLTKESMREWGKSLFEIPVVWGHTRPWLERKIIRQRNPELWDRCREENCGLIILGPHLGNWEVAGLACSARAGEMTIMFAPSDYPAVDKRIKDARSKFGGKLVPTDKKGVLALIKTLREGGVVGILPDQEPPLSGGVFAPFFGTQALTMSLIHNLIKRSGAKALFVYAKRVPQGFELVYREPPPALYAEDQQTSVDALNQGVEACVLDAVAQYQWEYKRYKKRPEGEERIYTKQNT